MVSEMYYNFVCCRKESIYLRQNVSHNIHLLWPRNDRGTFPKFLSDFARKVFGNIVFVVTWTFLGTDSSWRVLYCIACASNHNHKNMLVFIRFVISSVPHCWPRVTNIVGVNSIVFQEWCICGVICELLSVKILLHLSRLCRLRGLWNVRSFIFGPRCQVTSRKTAIKCFISLKHRKWFIERVYNTLSQRRTVYNKNTK